LILVLSPLAATSCGQIATDPQDTSSKRDDERQNENIDSTELVDIPLSRECPSSFDIRIEGTWYRVKDTSAPKKLYRSVPRDAVVRVHFANFHYAGGVERRLEHLKRYDLKRIFVSLDAFPIEEMESRGMLDQFESIEFSSADDIDFKDVGDLARMSMLRHIDLTWCTKTRDLRPLGQLDQLDSLGIPYYSTQGTIADLREVGVLPKLRFFKGLNAAAGDTFSDYGFLEEMKKLESLEIRYEPQLVAVLPRLTSLKRLHLWGRLEDTSFLGNLPGMEELVIECSPEKSNFEFLENLPNLRKVKFDVSLAAVPSYEGAPHPELRAVSSLLPFLGGREDLHVQLEGGDFRDCDFSGMNLSNIHFTFCTFENAKLDDAVISGCRFGALYYSDREQELTAQRRGMSYCRGFTIDQIKSTWNYKHGEMEDVILPEDMAEELQKAEHGGPEEGDAIGNGS
jgi:hypothetical protein